jgi:hypothetical protein
MKKVSIRVTLEMTEGQAMSAGPKIENAMISAMQAVLKDKAADYIRATVTGLHEVPFRIAVKSNEYLERQSEFRRVRREAKKSA